MINAPVAVQQALESGNFRSANIVKINLGDAYAQGSDEILYLTDSPHEFDFEGQTWTYDHALVGIEGISRKASRGSDKVSISFSVTDPNIVAAIRSERYINKPVEIRRVLFDDTGVIIGDFAIPVRTAWGISHEVKGDLNDRKITLNTDSILGDLNDDNGWFCVNSSHQQRHTNDLIMQHIGTVLTGDQAEKYTTNYRGVIDNEIKPPAVPVIYGRCESKPVPILMLRHRKSHSTYRHYFTTFIYVVSAGEINGIKGGSIRKDGERFDYNYVEDENFEYGGWSLRFKKPSENNVPITTDPKLNFWRQRLDALETQRISGMFGKGLTLMFVINRNRDDWIQSPPEFTVPIGGISVYDPRTGSNTPGITENPALQYYDYLTNTEYGAGGRGVTVSEQSVTDLANHFDTLPGSAGNPGINNIKINTIIDTGKPIVDNMNVWMETCRIFTSDYYGEFNLRVETVGSSVWDVDESDLIDYPEYESGEFTEKLNQLTYSIRQEVDDPSPDAPSTATMFVDVEATFPESGSTIHNDWLAEDGNIPNFDSKRLENITELEQAFYWTMVDARISRQPRTLRLPLDERAWLLEVGDIITFTSDIMGENITEWRINEINESDSDEESYVDVDCTAYANAFYSPDPNVIPTPVAPAQPPLPQSLNDITGFQTRYENGFNVLDFTPLSSSDVAWYAIQIWIKAWRVLTSNSSWSDNDAEQGLSGVPQNGDQVTLYNYSGYEETREYNNGNWQTPLDHPYLTRDADDEARYVVIDNPKVIEPPMSLEDIPEADYYALVTAFRVGEEGNAIKHDFTIIKPAAPFLNVTASNFELFIIPSIGVEYRELQFELFYNIKEEGDDPALKFNNATRLGLSGSTYTISALDPGTEYYLWCRTVLPYGISDFSLTTVSTSSDGTIYNNLTGFDVSDGKSVFSAIIYRRSPSALPIPTGGQFDFDTLTLTPPTDWSALIPAGTDPLYVSNGLASINGTTGIDSDIPWGQPEILVRDGAAATSGTSVYQAVLYQRSAFVPTKPADDSAVYNFGTNIFDTLPTGWTEVIPDGTDTVYATYATFSIIGNTGTDGTQTWTDPIRFVDDGEPGAGGISVYTFNLYLRAATAPPPATGGSYDFGANTVTPPDGGWTVNIPAGDDPIYVISTTASIQGDTGIDNSLTWTPPVQFVKNGADGQDGTDGKSAATLTIYRRDTAQPVTPSGGSYQFDNDILTAPLGWSAVPPAGNDPIYISTAIASTTGTTGTDSTLPWSQPEILASNGETGKSIYQAVLFQRADNTPTKPANNSATFNFTTNTFDVLPAGWSVEAPEGEQALYATYATFNIFGDTGTDSTQTWTTPVRFAGEGAVSTYTVSIYQRAASAPATPTGGQYDFGNNAITVPTGGWSDDVVEGVQPLYVSTATASISGATGIDATLSWSTPRKVAENGQDGVTGFVTSPDGRFYRQVGSTWTPSTVIAQDFVFFRDNVEIAKRTYEFRRTDGDGNLDVVLVAQVGEDTTESGLIEGGLTGSVTVTHTNSGTKITSGVESIPVGSRGAGSYSRDISPATAWDDAEADLATPGDNVIGDIVTLYNESATYVETRFWTGSAWTTAAQIFDGDILFPGSVTAAKINVADLFAQNITATGVIRYENGNNLAELGGGNLINTRGTTGTIFRVATDGTGILDGSIINAGTVPEGAISAAEVERLRGLIYPVDPGVTATGGTLSDSFNFSTDTSRTLSTLAHGSNPVTLRFNADTSYIRGSDPGTVSATIRFKRSVNSGSYTTIHTTTTTGTVDADPLGFWVVNWNSDVTYVDSTAPNNVNLAYLVEIDVNGTFQNDAGASFVVEEALSQSGGGISNALALEGQNGAYYLNQNNHTNKPSPTITLTGDVTGSATMTNLSSINISCSVAGANVAWTDLTGTPQASGNFTASGDIYTNGTRYYGDNKSVIKFDDSWVRLNPDSDFTSGVYCGSSVLRTDGQLQVGSNGSAFKVTNTGTVTATGNVTAADCIATSDIRVKDDLKRIENALDKVCNLTGYTFWREDTKQRSAGIIAQDLQEQLPEGVNIGETGLLHVSGQAEVGLIVEAIKEIKAQLDEIKSKVG